VVHCYHLAITLSKLGLSSNKALTILYACQIINALHLKDGLPVEFVAEKAPEIIMEDNNENSGLDWEMGEE
jgi:hypothetical protein